MLEFFLVAGSLCGLGSAMVLIYERAIRTQPIIHLHPGDYAVQLRIKNVTDEAVLIDEITVSPAVFGWTPAAGASPTVVIKPLEEILLRMMLFRDFEKLAEKALVTITISWRTTRRPWPFKRTVSTRIAAADVMAILARAKE
jgi:hypothetical protein